jgi:hypothetical protein
VPRVLEHDLDAAAGRCGAGAGKRREFHAVEPDRATRRSVQTGDAAGDRRLPAPGLADEGEALAGVDRERHVVGCYHRAARPCAADLVEQRVRGCDAQVRAAIASRRVLSARPAGQR